MVVAFPHALPADRRFPLRFPQPVARRSAAASATAVLSALSASVLSGNEVEVDRALLEGGGRGGEGWRRDGGVRVAGVADSGPVGAGEEAEHQTEERGEDAQSDGESDDGGHALPRQWTRVI